MPEITFCQIVDPSRDTDRTSMILKHGNGLAISKLEGTGALIPTELMTAWKAGSTRNILTALRVLW